jgi:hypothetical protein
MDDLYSKPSRLYAGFILYLIIGIDVFLVIGICLGAKMDNQKTIGIKRIEEKSAFNEDNGFDPKEVNDYTAAKLAFGDEGKLEGT